MDNVVVDNQTYHGITVKLSHCNLLIIQAPKGILACGFISIDAANKFNEVAATVSGVKTYDDMLSATVKNASESALKLGIQPGVTKGSEALALMI